MTIIMKINEVLNTLTKEERRIVEALLEHSEDREITEQLIIMGFIKGRIVGVKESKDIYKSVLKVN